MKKGLALVTGVMLMFSCESHVRYSALLKQTSFPQ